MIAIYVIVVLVLAACILVAISARIIKQYERVVLFQLGKVKGEARGPGLIFIRPVRRPGPSRLVADRHDADPVPGDHHARTTSASTCPRSPTTGSTIRSGRSSRSRTSQSAINQIAQTTLRSVVGRHTLDETLSETDAINQNIARSSTSQTEEWGIKVTVVELHDIQLPDSMQRAMARQAEAEREKRAKIIAAQGEALAAGELAHASDVMMAHPLRSSCETSRPWSRSRSTRTPPSSSPPH